MSTVRLSTTIKYATISIITIINRIILTRMHPRVPHIKPQRPKSGTQSNAGSYTTTPHPPLERILFVCRNPNRCHCSKQMPHHHHPNTIIVYLQVTIKPSVAVFVIVFDGDGGCSNIRKEQDSKVMTRDGGFADWTTVCRDSRSS